MSAQQLFDSFKNYLHVTTSVPAWSYNGAFLEVPEEFRLRVRVENTAPAGIQHPYITFRNVRVHVQATDFAAPVDGQAVVVPLDDATLIRGGDGGTALIRMKAIQALPFLFTPPEKIAVVTVIADVDQDAFFSIRNRMDVFQDINPD